MKIRLRRVALASVLTVAVAGTAVVPSAGASESGTARDGAVAVQRLHDELAEAVAAGDAPAIRWTLRELTPLLADVGQRYAGGRELAESASADASSVTQQIEALLSQKGGVPSIPELLNMLLQQLLQVLMDLINNLLGGGVPLPTRS
jgi:nitroreductase